jgi:peptide-methionine (S)-S-oxide reductase
MFWFKGGSLMPQIFILAPATPHACSIANASAKTLPDAVHDTSLAHSVGTAFLSQTRIVLAGGCFWGIQAVFQHVKGVIDAVSGYAGGEVDTAHYESVGTGTTGHAESVQVMYNPAQITLGQILKVFFSIAHDPTELNRQGHDHGTQYRSVIFYSTQEQKEVAEAYIDQLQQANIFKAPIVTKLELLKAFYPAEDYHQNYARLHPSDPYIAINDMPKVKALDKEFPNLYIKQ